MTVRFPWGSLLRGCLGHDDAVARGVAGLVAPGGALELTLAPAERDGLAALPTELRAVTAAARGAFEPHGLRLVEARPATSDEVMASSWGRRLLRGAHEDERAGDRRPVTIRLERRIRCNP